MKKRRINIIFIMLLFIKTISAMEEYTTGDFRWTFYDNGCQILAYTGDKDTVFIPSEIEGLPVTAIKKWSSYEAKIIVFPPTVRIIQKEAFKFCAIEEIKFSENSKLETIESFAFANNNLETVVLPKNNKRIHVQINAFAYNPIKSLIVGGNWDFNSSKTQNSPPSSLYANESTTFLDELEFVQFEEGVRYIESCSFVNCEKLKKVILPKTVEIIGTRAFYNCTSLTDIQIPNNTALLLHTYRKNEQQFRGCPFDLDTIKRLRSLGFNDGAF